MIMNVTQAPICETCQLAFGLSTADQHSIIILVILTGIALIACFVSVLWYAYRTRTLPEKDLEDITTHNNDAYNDQDLDYDDYVQPVNSPRRTPSPSGQRLRFDEENEK